MLTCSPPATQIVAVQVLDSSGEVGAGIRRHADDTPMTGWWYRVAAC